MNAIEKKIFDTLVSGRGINLPGVGSLSVERYPAEFISKGSLKPPHNKVVFSSSVNVAFGSAGDEARYAEWLAEANRDGVLEIKEVGVLRDGIFYPSVELHKMLNPGVPDALKVRRRASAGKKLLIALGVIAAAGVVLWLVVSIDSWTRRDMTGGKEESIALEEQRIASQQGEGTIAPVVAPEAEEIIAEQVAEKTDETTPEDIIQKGLENYTSAGNTASVQYSLVVGVFSTDKNADKLIASDPLHIGKESYKKMPFKGGKILVSAYSSTDKNQVDARRRELASINGDLWVYEQK